MGRAERDHALVGRACGQAIQSGARLEANGDRSRTAEIDDLLNALAGGASGYQDPL